MLTIFANKAPSWTFDWVLNTALGDIVKKSIHFKDISQVLTTKTFCVFTVIMHILLLKSEKRVTERNKRMSL